MFSRVLLIVPLLMSLPAVSQRSFLPAYIINNSGDTIRGYLDYKNWGKNPNSVNFKKSPGGEIKKLTTKDLKGFSVNDENYTRAAVKINERNSNMNEVSDANRQEYTTDTVFLLSIIEGSKSLYSVKLANREDYYFYLDKDTFRTYNYAKYIQVIDQSHYLSTSKKYIGQMILYFKDCPALKDKIDGTKYNLSSLRKTYEAYYDCHGIKPDYEIVQEKLLEFGIIAGASFTKLKFKNSAPSYMAGSIYPLSINFTSGIFLDIIIPRNFLRWSVYNELNFDSYQTTAIYNDIKSDSNYTLFLTTFGDKYIRLLSTIKYRKQIHKVSVFAKAGISLALAFAYTNEKISEHHFYDQVNTGKENSFDITRNYEVGLAAGLGIQFWHLNLEGRYEKPYYPAYSSPTSRYYILLGYTF